MGYIQTIYFVEPRSPMMRALQNVPAFWSHELMGTSAHLLLSRKGVPDDHPHVASIRKYKEERVCRRSGQEAGRDQVCPAPDSGFHAYYLVKTNDGVISMTVCHDRAGAEESNRVASTWLKDKLPTFATRPPEITTGEVQIQLEAELAKVRV
jgi:hypothetical protein